MVVDSDILNRIGYYSVLTIKSFTPEQAILEVLYKQSHLNIEGVYDRLKEVDLKWVFSSNSILTEDRSGLSGLNKIYISDLKKGKYHDNTFFQSELSKRDLNETLGIEAILLKDKLLLKNIGDSIPFRTIFTQHSDLVSCVEFNQKFGFVATASWDGMIRFWNINNGELLTVFGAFGDGQFVYIHPEGYYFASKNALRYIGFSLNNKMFSFDQFDLKYNRPDRVISTLPYYEEFYHQAFFRAYKKRLEKLGVQGSDFDVTTDIPILEVLNDLDSSLDQHKLTLSLSCIEKKDSLDRLHLFVNGVPEYGKYGKKINGKVFQDEVSLILNPGANLIQLYVTNTRNNSSLKKSLRVQAPPEKENSRLFILSIGVSNYEQNHYNLSYAAKDAKDVGTMFSTLSRYQLEKSKILMDSVVTKKNVIAMKNFFSEAKENDIVVLFVAGHGVLDDKLDYFFAPYEMDFKRPSKSGIAFGLFEDILENTKSRKKIMFLDACHSGEIDKDEVVKKFVSEDEESGEGLTFRRVGRTIRNIDEINSFELSRALFADMRLNNGATVISSAGGAEYAIEGEEWQNGVFTYVLLDGLLNKNADKNNDKRVTISELQLYIQNGVHSLTRGRQTPTSRVENLNYDFIIARKWND